MTPDPTTIPRRSPKLYGLAWRGSIQEHADQIINVIDAVPLSPRVTPIARGVGIGKVRFESETRSHEDEGEGHARNNYSTTRAAYTC